MSMTREQRDCEHIKCLRESENENQTNTNSTRDIHIYKTFGV